MITEKQVITNLKYLCRAYDGITKLVGSTRNRLQAINPDKYKVSSKLKDIRPKRGLESEENAERIENMDELQLMVWTKDKTERKIKKELKNWDIWTHWLQDVPGIGPFIASNLILFYYYRFIPLCKDCGADLKRHEKKDEVTGKIIGFFKCSGCGKRAKGDGILEHRIEFKDFPKVSHWWSYMGMGINNKPENGPVGVKQKRVKGVKCKHSTKGRTLCYHIAGEFNRNCNRVLAGESYPYTAFMLKMKEKHERKNDNGDHDKPWSVGHIHNAGGNEVAKLFLSHFWHVARTLEGKDTEPGPYIKQIKGHTVIPPFYWEDEEARV